MLIGHLSDVDIKEKILKFNRKCSCEQYQLRKANKNEQINIGLFNIEFSLACQGQCAMCCVDAPSWKGKYNYYEALTDIFNLLSPRQLVVQGGEVLIQKKTMAWLATIKNKSPETLIGLITNGNVSLTIVPAVESIFDSVAISMVGFQPETYNRIMGMDVQKTKCFVEALVRKKQVETIVKYLTTPSNIHEANAFLEWAISIYPNKCLFQDSHIYNYIVMKTTDNYWQKIFSRTGYKIRDLIEINAPDIEKHGLQIMFDTNCRNLFGLDYNFLQKFKKIAMKQGKIFFSDL